MPLTPETWLEEFTVNATTANTQTGAKVVQLANGNILVVWESNDNSGVGFPDGYDIIGQLFDPLGNLLGAEFRLNTSATFDDERDAEIAALANGGFVMVFEDQQNIGGAADGQDDIYAQYYDANGVSQAVILVVSGSSTDTFLNPRIAASSNTSVLIVYDDIVGGDAGVKGKIWNPIANTIGSEISLLAGGDGNADDISVTALDNGNYVIVHSADSGTSNAIYYRIVDSAGVNVKGFTAVANTATDTRNDFDPSVTALSNGGFAISWTDNDGSDVDVRYQAFDSAGNEVGPKGTVSPNGTSNLNTSSSIVALADGGFLVLYDDVENEEIQANRYDNSGTAVGSQFTIDTDGAFSAASVRATSLADGRVALVWNQGEIKMEILDTRDDANTSPVYTPDDYQIGTVGNDTFSAIGDLVYGHDGNDDISDGSGFSDIFGGNGDDTIGFAGVNSEEAFDGGNGSDWLRQEGADNVTVNLGAGTIVFGETQTAVNFENYIGASSNENVTGTSGANTLNGNAGNDTLNGLDGNDQLNGGSGEDSIDGGGNNDTVNGGQGDDILTGAGGADLVQGGAGNDTLRGGAGQDTINGGDGDDYVFQINQNLTEELDGGLGNDTLDLSDGSTAGFTIDLLAGSGTAGASTVLVLAGFENVIGTNFSDTFTGDGGANLLQGGTGNDTLAGGEGIDTLEGGDGNDRLLYLEASTSSSNVDIFDGGAGDDIFVIQNLTFQRIVDLAAGIFATGDIIGAGAIRGTLIDIESVVVAGDQDIRGDGKNNVLTATGGAFTNAIHAGGGSDTVNGGDGSDTLLGESGNDFLYGQNDADSLDGGAGTDLVSGGSGNDTLSGGMGDAVSDTLDGGDGDDLFLFGEVSGVDNFVGGAGEDTVDYGSVIQSTTVDLLNGTWYFGIALQRTISDVETVIMGSGDDSVDGSAADNTIIANGGNDTVNGDAGSDTIDGGTGDDFITSGGGFDSLVGGDGNDTLLSETADDTLRGGAGDDLLNGGNNRDLLYGGLDNDKVFGGNGLDTLYGEQGDDTLVGGKAVDSDVLYGGAGNDIVLGQEGEDTLYGEDGNDRVTGGSQSDLLVGGAGNDTLLGDGGLDTLWGGTGNDTFTGAGQSDLFVFEDGFGSDTITDFAGGIGSEKINLANVAAITDYADLVANHLSEVGGNAVISDGLGNTITLTGVTLATLIAADFDFTAPPPLPPVSELPAPEAAGASAGELMLAMEAIEPPMDAAPETGVQGDVDNDLSAGWVSLDDLGFDFA